jgi:hypothetical protein
VEAATHALRLMGSGLFDRCPRLNIILGHLGEGLPYSIWRVDNRNNWANAPHRCPAQKPMGEYFRANFHLTTAGNFRSQTLIDAMLELGADRIMFSTDYPFEAVADAADWFDTAPISEPDREKIGRLNAMRLFGLKLGGELRPHPEERVPARVSKDARAVQTRGYPSRRPASAGLLRMRTVCGAVAGRSAWRDFPPVAVCITILQRGGLLARSALRTGRCRTGRYRTERIVCRIFAPIT